MWRLKVNICRRRSCFIHSVYGTVTLGQLPTVSFTSTDLQLLRLSSSACLTDTTMSRLLTNMMNTILRRSTSSPTRASSTLSITVLRKNSPEPHHRYEPGGYHPVIAGEIYNQRYRAIRKLGWGLYSVVWLVQDIQFVFALAVSWILS